MQSISRQIDRDAIKEICRESGKEIIDIDYTEMENFCGNVIQLSNQKNESVVLMS